MKQIRTAKGRMIDMGALAKANEQTRAVSPGNITMNGRGDRLDQAGNVIQTVQTKSRAVRDTTTAPERTRLSDAPGSGAKKPAKALDPSATVVRRESKERDDGSQYIETEFQDGSIEAKELD